ncbi:hypothetical protein AGMMS50229_15760 [Campylobacterota bacterium]|nr:hypothetical protein AGMMS50229_15760 [Campylobacterota bacterium]
MRSILWLFLLVSSLSAYRDAFYLGAYGGFLDGTIEQEERDRDFSSSNAIMGARLGWILNSGGDYYVKHRFEFLADSRKTKEKNGDPENGWRLGISYALGYNVDWFLTQELVPFVSIGAGVGEIKPYGRGSDMSLGFGAALAFRYVEITAEVKREFWQTNGMRFPFQAPFNGSGAVDLFTAGINIKF